MNSSKDETISYSIKEGKNFFHFSSAHFVVGRNYIEGIHGHNFIVEITAESNELNPQYMVIDFLAVRDVMESILENVDHKTIIPKNSPWLEIRDTGDSWELGDRKRYKIPKEDVVLLPITNGTVEELAKYILDELKPKIRNISQKHPFRGTLKVKINEYPYQSASASVSFD